MQHKHLNNRAANNFDKRLRGQFAALRLGRGVAEVLQPDIAVVQRRTHAAADNHLLIWKRLIVRQHFLHLIIHRKQDGMKTAVQKLRGLAFFPRFQQPIITIHTRRERGQVHEINNQTVFGVC